MIGSGLRLAGDPWRSAPGVAQADDGRSEAWRLPRSGEQLVAGTTGGARLDSAEARLKNGRHLSERQVFVESLGRQPVDRARQQRDERAAGRIGPPGAAIEIHRHAAARARMLEQAEVLLRRAQEDGHLVERHAACGLVEHAPDDLHRLASFAWRRKQPDVAGALRGGGRSSRRRDGGGGTGPSTRARRRRAGRRRRRDQRARCGGRRRREPWPACPARAPAISRDEIGVGCRIERHVEQNDRQVRPADAGLAHGIGGEPGTAPRSSTATRIRAPPRRARSKRPISPAAAPGRREPASGQPGQAKLVDGARERLGKARHRRHGREVLELAGGHGIEDGARAPRPLLRPAWPARVAPPPGERWRPARPVR